MSNSALNIIIVAENALVCHGLKNQLRDKFGSAVQITCICDFKTLLKTASKDTELVIVDPFLDGKKGTDVLRSVKLINPNVAGIIHDTALQVIESVDGILHAIPQASGHAYSFGYN